MQAYVSPSHAYQVLGGTLNLLQAVAALVPTPPRSLPALRPNSTLLSPHKPLFRGAAAQILDAPTVPASALAKHTTPLIHPLRPPTALSTLLPYATSLTPHRSFHKAHPQTSSSKRPSQGLPPPRPIFGPPRYARPVSFSPYLSLFRSTPHPSPQVIAQISQLEAAANAAPAYVPAQLAFCQALLDSGLKQGYQRIVSRWERTLEFDTYNPLLRSDEAFQLYLTALVRSGHQASINHAVQRRERVLALPPLPPTAQPEPTSLDSASTSTTPLAPGSPSLATSAPSRSAIPGAAQTPAPAPAPPLSKSHEIAQAVLATRNAGAQSTLSLLGGSAAAKGSAGTAGTLGGAAGGGRENPIHVTVSEPKGTTVYRIIRFLSLAALSGFFILVILAVLLENSGLLKAGPQAAEFEPVQGKTVKFSDVHGVDEAKDELQEVVEFLKDPTNFATLGGKLPKGVLLTGPPGTGKTMLARAVAGEAGVPFLFASGSEFDEMFVGIGAKRIRDLFATARKKQPSIIFIDELDAIGSKRSPKDQHYMKQTLNQLLVELDGFQQTEGVIVIAATNFPQTLDQALVRPGRFDRKISVPLPDVKGRVQILKHHMLNVTTATDVDPTIIARGTPGFSGADLQNMVNQAAIQASREGYKFVLLKHFEWAKDRIVMGAERRSTYIDAKAKKLTAYHEGGHALVALYTEGAMPLHKVTCMPRGNALGYTAQLPEDDRFSVSFKEFVAEMDCCMGGRVAEELVYGPENVTSGCISDLAHATDVATRMVQNYGYSQKIGPVYYDEQDLQTMSSQKREEIEAEVRTLVDAAQTRAKQILSSREEELHLLAEALVEYETLNLEEVQKVIKGERIREDEDLSQV